MCGIAVIAGNPGPHELQKMLRNLGHRGPDGKGTHAIAGEDCLVGHCRLAIIDPEGGAQPFVSEEGSRALVANGMIYNYKELRDELGDGKFQTESDSETILRGYETYGVDIVSRLDGMFSFVLVDKGRMLAARDPIGIKPLYQGRRGADTLFASEMKALDGIADEVREFPAGHVYDSKDGMRRYYELPHDDPLLSGIDDILERIRDEVEAAVIKRLRSDVPLGAFLSGGLDSSIIAALARRHLDRLHTFTVGLEDSDDLAMARHVAEHLGTDHHEYVISPCHVLDNLGDILYALESFDLDLVRNAIPSWFVSRLAAKYVKVVLTGEGADELFAGYGYHRNYSDATGLNRELHRSVAAMHNMNLQRVDRMSMAFGLEARVPFLDTKVIETALRIDATLKLKTDSVGRLHDKWILRRAFDHLLPNDVVWREKAQFDQGSGISGLMATLTECQKRKWGGSRRSAEEAWYEHLLSERFRCPNLVLNQVAHWRGSAIKRADRQGANLGNGRGQ